MEKQETQASEKSAKPKKRWYPSKKKTEKEDAMISAEQKQAAEISKKKSSEVKSTKTKPVVTASEQNKKNAPAPAASKAHKNVKQGAPLKDSKLKIIPLGGMGEVGKNMTLIQYGESIICIDGGLMFPEEELLGIDLVIPDYSYLLENRDKLRGFVLTHGHEDHIGAMPYILKDFPQTPVFAARLTLGLLKVKLAEHKIKADLHEVQARQTVNIGPFAIEFIRITHSIPDSLGIAIHTPAGTVLMLSDFKMDMSPVDGQLMDFGRIAALGEEGVLLLMSDSTNVEKDGFTPSEKTVGDTFDKIFMSAKGRIFVTSFASNVHRLQQAIWSAEKVGRKVCFVGRGMVNVANIAMEMGYLQVPPNMLIEPEEVNDYPLNKILILTTGSQGEPLSGLSRMSTGDHKQVQILPGDLVIFSATPIPGNERLVGRTIDNLYRLGATVVYERSAGTHVSGHASREELKVLLNMVKPKYFVPMHGEYRMLFKHAVLAQQVGIPETNIFVLENGKVLDINKARGRIDGNVSAGRVLVDGRGVGDVGNTVLKDRKQLSQSGVMIVNLLVSKKNGKLLELPEIVSKGFIFEKEYEHIIDEVREKIIAVCSDMGKTDWNAAKGMVKNTVSKLLFDRTGRRPIIFVFISEV